MMLGLTLRCYVKGQGLLGGIRHYGLNLIVKGRYKELDTGPVLAGNVVAVEVVENISKKHEVNV
jgi:hypothetical protein